MFDFCKKNETWKNGTKLKKMKKNFRSKKARKQANFCLNANIKTQGVGYIYIIEDFT